MLLTALAASTRRDVERSVRLYALARNGLRGAVGCQTRIQVWFREEKFIRRGPFVHRRIRLQPGFKATERVKIEARGVVSPPEIVGVARSWRARKQEG